MTTISAHIVRRYGTVGGMETYVYELTRALAMKGQTVFVICETREVTDYPSGIRVLELGNKYQKPRWLAQLEFAKRVANYITKLPKNTVIHSHERTAVHHVTTFHGPPFLNRKQRIFDVLSPRVRVWSRLEKQELMGPQVQVILPNSVLIGEQLKQLYPEVAIKVFPPAYPGVNQCFFDIKMTTKPNQIGFLGREWKRKGLEKACNIVELLRKDRPELHFFVGGCEPEQVQHLFKNWPKDSYSLLGDVDAKTFYSHISLLLHPANAEPFGMVIVEANAAAIPVVISDQCGAASLITKQQGCVCSLSQSIGEWVKACDAFLEMSKPVKKLDLTWSNLAQQHIDIYQTIQKQLAAS